MIVAVAERAVELGKFVITKVYHELVQPKHDREKEGTKMWAKFVFDFSTHAQAIVKQTTHLSSSIGTPPVSLFEERSTSIGLRADIESKKLLGMSSTRSLSENM